MLARASLVVLFATVLGVEAAAQPYDGTWDLETPVSYTCCKGLISVDFSELAITTSDSSITVVTSDSHPGSLTGSFSTGSEFSAEVAIPSGCAETYTLDGQFPSGDTLEGTLQMTFVGDGCSCFGGLTGTPCVNQTFPITATAVPEAGAAADAAIAAVGLAYIGVARRRASR